MQWALWRKVAELTKRVGEVGDEVARRREECYCKEEDVLSERVGLQGRLDATYSQLQRVCNSLTAAHDQLELHRGRSAASHSWLESLILS